MKKFKRFYLTLMTGIFVTASAVNTYGAGWVQDGGYWWYQNGDGSYPCSRSQFIEGKLYQFDKNGYWIKTGNEQNEIADEAVYMRFINQNFAGRNVQIALVDLSNNGHEEMVVRWREGSDNATYIGIYAISQNQVKEISREIYQNFRSELHLCIRNGKACLLKKTNGIYQGEGDLTYILYDFKPDYTKNVIEEYSVHIIYDTVRGEKDYDLFEKKVKAYTSGGVLAEGDGKTELWLANHVLNDSEPIYEGSCGHLVKENGVYHYSGVIEGYDEFRIPAGGDWTQGFYDLTEGDFYVDDTTKIIIESESDYGFPVNGKNATEWLDDFYAHKQYWMNLRIKVKGNHIEELLGIYAID